MAKLQSYQGRGNNIGKVFYRIQPYIDGKRVTLRLGTGQKKAEKGRQAIEDLIDSYKAHVEPSASTKSWLENVVHRQLAKTLFELGLIKSLPVRFDDSISASGLTIGQLCDKYIRQLGADKMTSTIIVFQQAKRALLEFFGDIGVTSIDYDKARDYWTWLITDRGLAHNTAKQRLRYARSFFSLAIENETITRNPFKAKGLSVTQTAAVKSYVPRETIQKVIEHCPSLEWKLLFTMVRAIPMRIPSEIRELTWSDVDWAENTILIHSPKTRHIGKHARKVPIFKNIEPILSLAYDQANEGENYIFPKLRKFTNVAKLGGDVVTKAKVKKWTNFFNSLRASTETDLMDEYGLRLACQWAGNSPTTAMKNYALIHSKDFLDAGSVVKSEPKVDAKSDAINAVDAKSDAVPASTNQQNTTTNQRKNALKGIAMQPECVSMGVEGLEPPTLSV